MILCDIGILVHTAGRSDEAAATGILCSQNLLGSGREVYRPGACRWPDSLAAVPLLHTGHLHALNLTSTYTYSERDGVSLLHSIVVWLFLLVIFDQHSSG